MQNARGRLPFLVASFREPADFWHLFFVPMPVFTQTVFSVATPYNKTTKLLKRTTRVKLLKSASRRKQQKTAQNNERHQTNSDAEPTQIKPRRNPKTRKFQPLARVQKATKRTSFNPKLIRLGVDRVRARAHCRGGRMQVKQYAALSLAVAR